MTRNRFETPLIVAGFALAAWASVAALRSTSFGEGLELKLYDFGVRHRASEFFADTPVALVAYTEENLNDFWEHPVTDAHLAQLFEKIAGSGPTVIGVDTYRSKAGEALNDVLRRRENIIMIKDLGDSPNRQAPPALENANNRIAVSSFPLDGSIAPVIRRGFLTVDEGEDTYLSLAFLTALSHLTQRANATLELLETSDEAHPYRYKVGSAIFEPFTLNDGAYVGADDRGFQVLLDFPFRGDYPERSFKWIMEATPAALEKFVAGKIVLVGVTAETVKDSFATPLRDHHRGLQLHAALTDQVLRTVVDGNYRVTRTVPDWVEHLLLLFWAALGAIIALDSRMLWRQTIGLAAAAIIIFLFGYAAFHYKVWIPAVAPAAGLVLSFGLAIVFLEYRDRRRAADLEEILRRHLGPDQFNLVWSERETLLKKGKIPGRVTEATLLMSDLVGYTRTTEGLDHATLLQWLNRYMEPMAGIIGQHGGMIKSYAGDAIYAVFGVHDGSDSTGEHRAQALRCALEMENRLIDLNREFEAEGLPTTAMRIGINTGVVTVGSLGGRDGMEYAIVGDCVNVAARLESYDKEKIPAGTVCRILAGGATLQPVQSRFDYEPIGEIELYGKEAKVPTYHILSAKN